MKSHEDTMEQESAKRQALQSQLAKAVDGLLYPSDFDYPFEVHVHPSFFEGRCSEERFLEWLQKPEETPIEQQSEKEFFGDLAFNPAFKKLHSFLKSKLDDLQIFRVGQTSLDVYLIGQDASGNVAVFFTRSLET